MLYRGLRWHGWYNIDFNFNTHTANGVLDPNFVTAISKKEPAVFRDDKYELNLNGQNTCTMNLYIQ